MLKNVNILLILSSIFVGSCLSTYDHEKIFTGIYTHAVWGRNKDGVGFSGLGSEYEETVEYRSFLQQFLKEKNIKSVVDIGCGDWEFSQYIDWSGIHYIGYDIVEWVIQKNIQQFVRPGISFIYANFLNIELPEADLLLCKHVLQHLSNEDIFKLIPQLRKYKYCLITNETDPRILTSLNYDNQPDHRARRLDLTRSPFNLSGIKVLNYRTKKWSGMHQVVLIEN